MRKRLEWNWEMLDKYQFNATHRAKVIGGWLVHHHSQNLELGMSETMCFVPDPDHEWTIKPPVVEEKAAYDASDFEPKA